MTNRLTRFARRHPELLLLRTDESRRAAMRVATTRIPWLRKYWRILVAPSVVVGFTHVFCANLVQLPRWVVCAGVATGLAGSVMGFSGRLVRGDDISRRLREHLNDHGVPVCMKCGYSLHGLDAQRCPECGKAFDSAMLRDSGAPAKEDPD